MSRTGSRRGAAAGDVLLVVSVLALVAGAVYPRVQRAALRRLVDRAAEQVQVVADAAERFQGERDRWPDPTGAGETPEELAEYLPEDFAFARERYQLDFDVWERAEEAPRVEPPEIVPGVPLEEPSDTVPPPPTILYGSFAGVTVRSGEAPLLAGLLERFGPDRSFVHDGAWTLVFASVPGR